MDVSDISASLVSGTLTRLVGLVYVHLNSEKLLKLCAQSDLQTWCGRTQSVVEAKQKAFAEEAEKTGDYVKKVYWE